MDELRAEVGRRARRRVRRRNAVYACTGTVALSLIGGLVLSGSSPFTSSVRTVTPAGEPSLVESDRSAPGYQPDGAGPATAPRPGTASDAKTTPVPTGPVSKKPAEAGHSTAGVVFVSRRGGTTSLYLMNRDGGSARRLTNASGDEVEPAWSPDGRRVVFTRRTGTAESPQSQDLAIADVATGSVTPLSTPAGRSFSPSWSPDGRDIVFTHLGGEDRLATLWIVSADSDHPPARLTDGSTASGNASWSPDGHQIVFTRFERTSATTLVARLWVMSRTGAGSRALGSIEGDHAVFSPDGSRVAFVDRAGGRSRIAVAWSDGTHVSPVTNAAAYDSSPSWLDAATLIFDRDPDGHNPGGCEVGASGDGPVAACSQLASGPEPSTLWSVATDGTHAHVLVESGDDFDAAARAA